MHQRCGAYFKEMRITFIFSIMLFGCGKSIDYPIAGKQNDSIEYFSNGNPKSYKVTKSDSVFDINFYNQFESGAIDSQYRYRYFYDTLIPHEEYIYTDKQITKELLISKLKTDSGEYYKFNLLEPRNEWISIYIRGNGQSFKKDTLIAILHFINPRVITIKANEDSVINGYIKDWRFLTLTDTIGSIGHVMSRYLKFKISKPKKYAPQQGA